MGALGRVYSTVLFIMTLFTNTLLFGIGRYNREHVGSLNRKNVSLVQCAAGQVANVAVEDAMPSKSV